MHDAGTQHTRNSSESCNTSGTQPVNAGTHEVALDIGSLETEGLADAGLQAIYIPYGPTG